MDKQEKAFIKALVKVFMQASNKAPRAFYSSRMLRNGGKLVIKVK